MNREYRVLAVLSRPTTVSQASVKIQGHLYTAQVSNELGKASADSFDLVIVDKPPSEVTGVLSATRCRTTAIITSEQPRFEFQKLYEELFDAVKYIPSATSDEEVTQIVQAELVKSLAIQNRVFLWYPAISKYTRRDFWRKGRSKLGWLLLPFISILAYYCVRNVANQYGYHIALLKLFVDYQPDADVDIRSDLRLVTLLYSLCSLGFYYASVLKLFDAIDTAVFQLSPCRRRLHRICQLASPVVLFVSGLIIFKELFVFKRSQAIAQQWDFINIGAVFDHWLPLLKDEYLIWYFFGLDVVLWIMIRNVLRAIEIVNVSIPETSSHRKHLLTSARRSVFASWMFSLFVLALTFTILVPPLFPDSQSRVVVQLVLLQGFYLLVNLAIIFGEFKYE